LEKKLADQRLPSAARTSDDAERGVEFHGQHHAAESLGVALRAIEEIGVDTIGERVF